MFKEIRNVFNKPKLVPIEFDSEGWAVFFGGARRHKIIKQTEEEFVFRCQYSWKDPFTTAGRESPAYPLLHYHRYQDEWIKVVSGKIGYVLAGKEYVGEAGGVVSIPRGTTHTFWCDPSGGEDAVLEFTARPGTGIDAEWLNTVYGIMESLWREGRTLGFWQVMVFALNSDAGPGALPKWLGAIVVAVFSRIGLLLGYRARHAIYQNVEFKPDATTDVTVNDETSLGRDLRQRTKGSI